MFGENQKSAPTITFSHRLTIHSKKPFLDISNSAPGILFINLGPSKKNTTLFLEKVLNKKSEFVCVISDKVVSEAGFKLSSNCSTVIGCSVLSKPEA